MACPTYGEISRVESLFDVIQFSGDAKEFAALHYCVQVPRKNNRPDWNSVDLVTQGPNAFWFSVLENLKKNNVSKKRVQQKANQMYAIMYQTDPYVTQEILDLAKRGIQEAIDAVYSQATSRSMRAPQSLSLKTLASLLVASVSLSTAQSFVVPQYGMTSMPQQDLDYSILLGGKHR
jgi:hypothetical protein